MSLADSMRAKVADLEARATKLDEELVAPAGVESRSVQAIADDVTDVTLALRTAKARLVDLETEERKAALADETRAKTGTTFADEGVTRNEALYRPGRDSWFQDLYRAQVLGEGDSRSRLAQGSKQHLDEVRARAAAGNLRALTTVDGVAGDFVPPVYLVDQWIAYARPGRITADLVNNVPLPAGTDSINLPKIATGTAIAEQTTQNTTLQNTDLSTSTVTGAVATLGGIQVIAAQLLDQSPINFDDVVLRDLAADHAMKTDVFVLNNNATNKVGILNVASPVSVAYTDASPAVAGSGKLYGKISDTIQQIHSNRYLPPTVIVMHPRRWAWFLAAYDTQNRPLVVPGQMMAQPNAVNTLGTQEGVVSQGFVGTLQGLPVVVDANVPTNTGAGTNQDPIVIMRAEDLYLYETAPKFQIFTETKADQFSVLARATSYAAIIFNRYPKAIGIINGTGLVPPTY